MNSFTQQLQNKGIPYKENEPLSQFTSLKIGGNADYLAFPQNTWQIQELIQCAKQAAIPFYLLGNGSNTLVLDEGVRGLVIVLKDNFSKIQINQTNSIEISAQAGALIKDVCLFSLQLSLGGMEFAYGIPASVGGAMVMNAGAYGGEMKDIVKRCTFLNEKNEVVTYENEQLRFAYRHSIFLDHSWIVLEATFQLFPDDPIKIKTQMDHYMSRRIEKQPLEYPSAGSTFKRPQGSYASLLIEQSGLKGYRHHGVMVSDKHSGFVINIDHATSKDMLELIQYIQQIVREKSGYELECEMKIME